MKNMVMAIVACCIFQAATSDADGQLFRRRLLISDTCPSCDTETAQSSSPSNREPIGYAFAPDSELQTLDSQQVDQAEVLRLGDMVQHVGGDLYGAGQSDAYIEAMAPPASDADKWFITVVASRTCPACTRLKQDWATDPWLLSLANPNDPEKSWAHYNVYMHDDESQAWRFENIQITGYPTVLVQPPRSGIYGPVETVVFQGTYGGDPHKLATQITRAIRLYVSKLPKRPQAYGQGQEGTVGIDPPWLPAPQNDPQRPLFPRPPDGRPLIPPIPVQHQFSFPWQALITLLTAGVSIPAIIALVIWGILFVRAQRKKAGRPLLLDDEQLERLVQMLQKLAETEKQPAQRRRTRRVK